VPIRHKLVFSCLFFTLGHPKSANTSLVYLPIVPKSLICFNRFPKSFDEEAMRLARSHPPQVQIMIPIYFCILFHVVGKRGGDMGYPRYQGEINIICNLAKGINIFPYTYYLAYFFLSKYLSSKAYHYFICHPK